MFLKVASLLEDKCTRFSLKKTKKTTKMASVTEAERNYMVFYSQVTVKMASVTEAERYYAFFSTHSAPQGRVTVSPRIPTELRRTVGYGQTIRY